MARLISKQEAEKIGRLHFGRKHFVNAWIGQMKKGDILHITRKDFTWKDHTPNIFVKRIMKSTKKKFTFEDTLDKSGWIVERVE
jgi:hypothetical protein